MRYEKFQPGKIKFKYNCSEDFQVLEVYRNNKRRRHIIMPAQLEILYSKQLPISSAMKKD